MRLTLVLSLFLSVSLFAQSTYTTGFEPPFLPGSINGQFGWGSVDNSPTGGDIVLSPARGTQSLALTMLKDSPDFQFVANRLFSPLIDPAAGESASVHGGIAAVGPQSHFQATLWYRTPSTPLGAAGTRIAQLNPSSRDPRTPNPGDQPFPANRYAQVRIVHDAGGTARVEIGWYSSYTSNAVNTFEVAQVAFLNWGQWYRFEYLIHFVDGTDGNAPNDRFTLTVFDETGNQVGTACGSTWELPYRQGFFGGGLGARAVNGFDFWATTGVTGTVTGHLDDLTFTAFEPAEPFVAEISGPTNVCFGETTTLTASGSGGGAGTTGFIWRNGANEVVGTDAQLTAGAGTYTVTVTNSLCETASDTLTVTEYPQLQVAITGSGRLTALVTGGTGVVSYQWRDELNALVGTGPTLDAGPGTYTLTVTATGCIGTVTASAQIVVPAFEPIPTLGTTAMLVMMALFAIAAVLRMR